MYIKSVNNGGKNACYATYIFLWNMSIIRQSFIINNYLYTNEKVMLLDIPVYFWNSFVFSVLFFSIILIPRFKKKNILDF